MADRNAKIYASRLVKGRYGELRQLAEANPPLVEAVNLQDALVESVRDQLELASEFISAARNLLASGSNSRFDIDHRNALSRAYYGIHHTVRAVVRYAQHYDPYGHPTSIDAFIDVAGDKRAIGAKLTARFGDLKAASRRLKTIIEERHHSDYDPYGASEIKELPLDIQKAAISVIEDAEAVHDAAVNYLRTEGVIK